MINKDFLYAVIGASNNEEKYGYKVFKDLLEWWYKVVPINPIEKNILGEKVFSTLSQVKEKIDVAIFITQPKVTENILKEAIQLWIKKVWFQPWSQSPTTKECCKKNMIECIHDACIMIQRKK